MKKSIFIICISFLFSAQSALFGQSLLAKASGQYVYLTEFETGFITGGVGVEAALGYSFSLGIDAGIGANTEYNFLVVMPSIKFYPFESLHGFFIGTGVDVYSIKTKDGSPIGYPAWNEQSNSSSDFAPQLFIGAQTVVNETISIGIQVGLGHQMNIETAMFQAGFSVGVAF